MSTAIETVQLDNGEAIEIFQDEYPDNPRSWDNLGHILNFHDKYNLGDENTTKSKFEDSLNYTTEAHEQWKTVDKWEDVEKYLREERGAVNILPLMVYEHSGITMYVGTTGDRWDSSRVGYIYTTEERIQKWGAELKDVDMILRGEVETMDKYLRGEVYGWQIVRYVTCDHGDQHREVIDSSWGYHSIEEAVEQAKEAKGVANAN
jgi:hypothetical protein